MDVRGDAGRGRPGGRRGLVPPVLWAPFLLVALYLPGHFLGRTLARKGDGWAELALLRLAVSAAVAAPLLVSLALLGWFTAPVIVACLGLCAALSWAVTRRFGDGAVVRRSGWDAAVLGLTVVSAALYAWPAEYVVNNRDPGVYALLSAELARTGALISSDPLVGAVAPFHTFFEGKKYPGFFLSGADVVVPQFFPGPFAFLGLGSLGGGVWGALFVAPVFGVLSVLTAYALGRELFGRPAGFVGAGLLAGSYAQVWWARQPSSEVMAQFFILAGLWLTVRFVRGAGPVTGVVAGALLGGAMLVRVDGFLAAAAVPVLIGFDLLTRRPAFRWLWPGVPLALFGGAALLYLNTVGGRYLYIIYFQHGLDRALGFVPLTGVGAALLAGVLWYVRRRWGLLLGGWAEAHGRRLALAGAAIVAGLTLWGYFVAPVPWESLPDGSRSFDAYGSQVLVRMVWFVTPVVAVLALVGLLLAARWLDRGKAVLLGAVLAFGLLYTVIPNVAPDLPWATRRFVPAVFPGLCLLAGYAAVEAGRTLGRAWSRRAGLALTAGLVVLAFGWTAYTAAPILGHRELAGAVADMDRVDAKIPESRVVFVEAPAGLDPTASTFDYLYGRPVLPYDRERFWRESDELREAGLLEDAVYVTTDGRPPPLMAEVDFVEVADERVELRRLASVEGHEPRMRTEVEVIPKHYRIFRVEDER